VTDSTPSWESTTVAAVLARRSHEDVSALLADLVTLLSEAVPGARVQRALIRRHITSLRLPLGGTIYLLQRHPDGSFEAARQQEVRGVVIRTEPMELDAFLGELGPAIDAELRRSERGRDALRTWLESVDR
jgi:hypothetical protein